MKVVYHPDYTKTYERDPAAAPGRMEAIIEELRDFETVQPVLASTKDIELCHSDYHIAHVRRMNVVYPIAMLAVGGAIKSAELAVAGEPAFGLIRPPGHHASQDSCWGFCFFNNIAIALSRLIKDNKIQSALILDFDLHYGDGTANIFQAKSNVTYFHPEDSQRQDFIDNIESFLDQNKADMIAVSAGFDRYLEDWGRLLTTEDYRTIGQAVKQYALKNCDGKRFAVLEGGYNHKVLGINVHAFIEGMD